MDSTKLLQQGQTLKRGKIRESHMEKLVLEFPPGCSNADIRAAFSELVNPESPAQQIGAVEKLLRCAAISEENAKLVTQILVSSLLQLQSKAQLRIKITKFVSTIALKYPEQYEEALLEIFCLALSDLENPLRVVQAVNLSIEDGSSLFSPCKGKLRRSDGNEDEGRPILNCIWAKIHPHMLQGILSAITQLWLKQRDDISSVETTQIFQDMQQLIKNSASYLQQFDSENPIENFAQSQTLLDKVVLVLEHPSCPLDLRINCGQLVAVVHKMSSKDAFRNLVHSVMNESSRYAAMSPLARLAIINGMLCVSHGRELYNNLEGGLQLGIQILEVILNPVFQSNDGSMAISTVRMLQHWTLRTIEATKSPDCSGNMKKLLYPSCKLMSCLMEYIWLLWDHFLDSVKHATKDSFQNLLKIQMELFPEECERHYMEICKTLLIQPSSRKYKLSAVSCLVPVIGCQTLLMYEPQLPELLLILLKDSSMASHAAELIEVLFTVHIREVSPSEWQDVWLPVFLDMYSKEMQTFGFELLFKKLLLTCPDSLDAVVGMLSKSADQLESEKLCLLIMCVKIGRQSAYWQKKCQEKNADQRTTTWKFMLPYETISLCLKHIDESVQMAALSLICESPKSTEVPEKMEMDMLLDYFTYNITNQTPSYRQHLVKSTKKLFLRIKESVRILLKTKDKNENGQAESLDNLRIFCKGLLLLMMQNLQIGSNAARRVTSLLILELFCDILYVESGAHVGVHDLSCNPMYIDTLLYVLDDSYESNKIIALKLLLFVSQNNSQIHHEDKVSCLVDAACQMASSCRPPDTVTASYVLKYLLNNPLSAKIMGSKFSFDSHSHNSLEVFLNCLLQLLKSELKVARMSLLRAAASGPMYGLLLCLRTLLSSISGDVLEKIHSSLKLLIKELFSICYEISDLVASVVRNSSPEGHLPMDLDLECLGNLKAVLQASLGNEQPEGSIQLSLDSKPDEVVKAQAVSAQMLLLCAWRSVKEISLIFGDVLQHFPLYPHPLSVLNIEEVKTVGRYFLTQLSETKHRGAFEQSYLGFSRICEQLWRCSEEQLHSMPEEWLGEVLYAVQNDGDDRLCATRRSAGVPFIIQSILSSEPNVRGGISLRNTMDILLSLAYEDQYKGSDARIHSFNILRALYRDTRLGDSVVPYAPYGVKAAIKGYKSNSWAERNAASLLFASLITRIFGVKKTQDDLSRKNAMSALVFFRRYPELYDFLKVELEAGALGVKEGSLVPALFPVLLLLARLSPSPVEGRSSTLSVTAFTPAVMDCITSSVLHLRSLASHALVPLVTPDNVHDVICTLCDKASIADQNGLHGSLLCLLKLMRYFYESISEEGKVDSVAQSIMSLSWAASATNPCLLTRCCALEIFTFLVTKRLACVTQSPFSDVRSASLRLLSSSNPDDIYKPWFSLCSKAAASYLLNYVQTTDSDITELTCSLLSNSDYEVRLLCLNFLECIEDIPLPIFFRLLHQVQGNELHTECQSRCFHILYECLSSGRTDILECSFENWVGLLTNCMEKLSEETCLELLTELVKFTSSVMMMLLSKYPAECLKSIFSRWLEVTINFSGSENDVDVRLEVAQGISSSLAYFSHQSISGKAKLDVYEVLVTLLQDDDDSVRETVATNVRRFIDVADLRSTNQPSRVLEILCDVIAGVGTAESLSLLVKLILREDTPEGFGLSQEDDRVFDKGEMNSHREVFVVARAAAKSLSEVLKCRSESLERLTFIRKEVIPLFCSSPRGPVIENGELSMETLLTLLAEELHHIYTQVSCLSSKAIFCVKNIEIWLTKLGCCSLLWKVLKVHSHMQSDLVQTVLTGLSKSLMPGLFVSEIIDCLT